MDEPDRSYEENARIVRERKRRQEEEDREAASKDLKSKVEISIKTTMVGAVEEVERAFEDLYGSANLTKAELKEKFQEIRKKIFDRGNKSLKEARHHVGRFNVTAKSKAKKILKFRLDK